MQYKSLFSRIQSKFNKLPRNLPEACNFIKKETLAQTYFIRILIDLLLYQYYLRYTGEVFISEFLT